MRLILALLVQTGGLLEEEPGRDQGPDRAPQGWVPDVQGALQTDHPLQALAGPYGARFAVSPPLT